ncbi:MAG: SLC13 family permease, partial [Myxococcota bacterium]
ITIATALGLGQALEQTGVAQALAEALMLWTGSSPLLNLIALLGATALISALVTNHAAAVLMFPIAWATAEQLGVSPIPLAIAIMIGASASFATPIGYQTNLMVYGPGGYRFLDYARIGVPITILAALIAAAIIPIIWPFHP